MKSDGETTSFSIIYRKADPPGGPLRFEEQPVLPKWMFRLFDKKGFDQIAEPMKAAELAGLNEGNNDK